MRILAVIVVVALSGGCATSNNTRTGAPTCSPYIGMDESTFVDCACLRPAFNPEGGIRLDSTHETAYGVTKRYRCAKSARDGDVLNIGIRNGKIESISNFK